MREGTWTLRPCPRRDVVALAKALEVSETTAGVLVRRGYGDPGEARAFLSAERPDHDPLLLGDMEQACAAVRGAIEAGRRICVHGDYDVDGICATALAVLVLRDLGAEGDWHLPSRFEEGYGVARETLARFAAEGCGLLLTVDCGITAVEEIAEAKAAGLQVVVTDHHRPGDALPDCPVVATRPSEYPFPELCGTGVVFKLAQALGAAESAEKHLDLVALATVADVVPLLDENRALVVAGLRRLARTSKPGLRALMRAAHVDPASVDAGAIAFRLAPRINAAGRLRLAGAEWHRGVIGIVASRLVERFHRPVVLIAGAEEEWTGSGRSIPAFDLHEALAACSGVLTRFGGHRAAAGLSLKPENLDEFARLFAKHADGALEDGHLVPTLRVDAVVDGRELTLGLCEELEGMAPFGLGTPAVTLVAVGCELSELGAVGDGKHLKLAVSADGARSGAIAFGQGGSSTPTGGVGPTTVGFH